MTNSRVLAIGVDGGASGVRALAVRRRSDGFLEAAGELARRDHEPFVPPGEVRDGCIVGLPPPTTSEIDAARARVRATVDAIAEAAGGHLRIELGVCWPGHKTDDARGVDLMRNGPRDLDLLDELEHQLVERGFEFTRPLPKLASDGVAGALGELWSASGALRGTHNALYFAGGSGLAEAVLVAGRVRALDELTPRMPKAFETERRRSLYGTGMGRKAGHGTPVYEDLLAPGRWSHLRVEGRPLLAPRSGQRPIDWLDCLEPEHARHLLVWVADALVDYIVDRMRRLSEPAGIVPERAVVGARLGQFIALGGIGKNLGERISTGLEKASLPADFVRPSQMLEAPAFGAAALALGLENEDCPS